MQLNYEKMAKAELISKLKSLESSVENAKNKGLESTVKESQEKYRTLVETINDAIFVVEIETGLILNVNKHAEVLLGIPTEEIIGMLYTQVHPVEEVERTKNVFEKYAKIDKSIISEDIFVQHKDGRKIPVEISTSVFESDGKKVILGVFRNITERRWTEEQKETIIRTTLDGFFLLDIQGRILEVNDAYCNLTGYSREELLRMNVSDVEALEKPEETKKHVQQIIETGGDRFESKHRCKDGRIIDIEISCNYVNTKGGRLFSFMRDITERKKTEVGLRKLSRAVKQSPSTIIITDNNGNIEYVNPKFTTLTGYTFEEAIGKTPRMLKSSKTPPEKHKRLWITIKSGAEWRGELCNKKKNGELYWESVSISSVKDENGMITHFVGIKEDISKRKNTEKILHEQKNSLEQKNIALREVLGQLELEKKQIKDNVMTNAETLLLPIIQKLRLTGESRKYVQLLRKNLQELTSSFGARLTEKRAKLTSREIEICNMIKNGLTSKEIASISNTSFLTIEKHRINIRRKLGISNKGNNLASFLKTL